MNEIKVNAPDAGEWIMEQVKGRFIPKDMCVLSSHYGSELLGGFVVADYVEGGSAIVHMAGKQPGWCSRQLLRALFEYGFRQLSVQRLFAVVRSDNHRSIEQCLRAGWRIETVVRDMYPNRVHLLVLYMTEAICPWVKHQSKSVISLPQLERAA